ncbi:MAG TPA: response regulator [Kiritimatiellia bacterium]|mgnify:CR=1 FL=1|nr:response regulator [Kiritimatiellia bacterium]
MNKRILIVDDEAGFTRLMAMNLEEAGNYEIKEVNDPAEATRAIHFFKPDVCVLDILMPGKSGLQLAEEWMHDPRHSKVPILFLTAAVSKDQPGLEHPLLEQHRVLVKPIRFDELLAAIEDALKSS